MLWMLQRVFFGDVTNEKNLALKDLNTREVLVFLPLIVMIVWLGVYSRPFVSRMEPAVNQFVEQMTSAREAYGIREPMETDRTGRTGPVGQQPAAGSPFAPPQSVARPGGHPLAATRAGEPQDSEAAAGGGSR
jgi:hypothetical protein